MFIKINHWGKRKRLLARVNFRVQFHITPFSGVPVPRRTVCIHGGSWSDAWFLRWAVYSCSRGESVTSRSSLYFPRFYISSSSWSSIMDMLISIANVIIDNWRTIYSNNVESLDISPKRFRHVQNVFFRSPGVGSDHGYEQYIMAGIPKRE